MSNRILEGWCGVLLLFFMAHADTGAYRFKVVRNDVTVNGQVHLDLEMRITEGTLPRTLHSFTLDVHYPAALAASDDDMTFDWSFGAAEGYRTAVSKQPGRYRVLAAGHEVNKPGGAPLGWSLSGEWQKVVRLKYKITVVEPINLTTNPVTEAAAYFINPQNQPRNLAAAFIVAYEGIVDTPMSVQLLSFLATASGTGVAVEWSIAHEDDLLGFNLYRALTEKGPFHILNMRLIRGRGTPGESRTYRFVDEGVEHDRTYYYQLQQFGRSGSSELFGPIQIHYKESQIPAHFVLLPNYPNPFNEETRWQYTLPERSRVTISILNIQGKVIREWNEEEQGPGLHIAGWDGRDRQGEPVSSGVYFINLKTPAGQAGLKMIKLR